jgi:hypothetical protein
MRLFYCISFFILFTIEYSYSQTDSLDIKPRDRFFSLAKDNWDWGVNLGSGFNGTWEFGIRRYNWVGVPLGLASYGLSNEFVYGGSVFNPKITAEFSWLFIGSRISVIDYLNSGANEFRVRPEIGFTLFGVITLFYGNDIKINDTGFGGVPINRWFLGINWPFDRHRGGYF